MSQVTPDLLLRAYAHGVFPMAEARDSEDIFWVEPKSRGVFPLDHFHISRSLRRRILRDTFQVTVDHDFSGVVRGCADREETWINDTIYDLYLELEVLGFAHSLEVWEGGKLAGGVFGIALHGAFFGESMFSLRTDASKVALAYLVDRLRQGGYRLFDTQFLTPHLASLGAIEIPRDAYLERLEDALSVAAEFSTGVEIPSPQELLQRSSQTS